MNRFRDIRDATWAVTKVLFVVFLFAYSASCVIRGMMVP